MFIDASAFIAILTDEPDGSRLASILEGIPTPITSAIAVWETVIRIISKHDYTEAEARDELALFMKQTNIGIVPIGEREAALATGAFAVYGKRRHPAALNMGDCFAYACAKANRVPLLYIGNDFSQTDVNDGFTEI